MDDPILEIPLAINLCAGAATADNQVTSFHRYFTPNSSFLHPLCYVPPRRDSRSRIIGIYLFYRALIPHTKFEIQYVAFDERVKGREGHLFVELIQEPEFRIVSWVFGGWRPRVPMHINFHVVKLLSNPISYSESESDSDNNGGLGLEGSEGKWYIDQQEDVIQPMSLMLAIPGLATLARLFYLACEVLGLLNAWLFMAMGVWRPEEHLRKLRKDGLP